MDPGYPAARERAGSAPATARDFLRAGRSYWAPGFTSPVAGQFAWLQLWNPAGSARVVKLRSVVPNMSSSNSWFLQRTTAPLVTLYRRGTARELTAGSSAAEVREASLTARPGVDLGEFLTANQDLLPLFGDELVVLLPGVGLAFGQQNVTVQCRVLFTWDEWTMDEYAGFEGSAP